MTKQLKKSLSQHNSDHPVYGKEPCIGRIAGVNSMGEILVQVGSLPPAPARLVAPLSRIELTKPEYRYREALVLFENGDSGQPIIVALMAAPLEELVDFDPSTETAIDNVQVDGKRLVIEGKEEIVLRCGSGSITLRKDGKIVIKGSNILSRSTGNNRIKGGSVSIN